jgi:hypothetical protein
MAAIFSESGASQPPERHIGVVALLHQELGAGYILESSSGRLFGVSRNFLDVETWNRLTPETHVSFTDNGFGCVNPDLTIID